MPGEGPWGPHGGPRGMGLKDPWASRTRGPGAWASTQGLKDPGLRDSGSRGMGLKAHGSPGGPRFL